MAKPGVTLRYGSKDTEWLFREFDRRMSSADREIKNALTRQLRADLKPLLKDYQQAALAIPSSGGAVKARRRRKNMPAPKQPARLLIKRGMFTSVKFKGKTVGATLGIKRGAIQEQRRGATSSRVLPELLESSYKPVFRRPVYGKGTTTQRTSDWFWPTWNRHRDTITKHVHDAVSAALKKL